MTATVKVMNLLIVGCGGVARVFIKAR